MDVGQLRSFLGLVNYYGKFLPNLASTLAPLYLLLHKHTDWRWGIDQSRAFEQAKGLLTSCILLVHFDPDKELLVSCDASPYGLGAVLSHRMEDGSSKPIYYASRTLSAPERGYSQLDKEGLAIIFAVKKFHTFLHGRHFTIISDHKPLQCILGHRNPVPTLASARLQRWALLLGAYDYKLEYMSACQLRHADGLSRLPLPESPANTPVPGETILPVDNMELSSLSFRKVRQMTDSDKVLSRVRLSLQRGWGIFDDNSLLPFDRKKDELSIHDGCILRGTRVVIPTKGRELVMDMLHQGHPGISRMKSIARGYVWWPGIDGQLEERVKRCTQCQLSRHSPTKDHLHPWEWPQQPWVRVHVDYAGPFLGKMFFLVVDAHSKWLEVAIVNSATSTNTIDNLRMMFSTHGLPEVIVSDNGSVFSSKEFSEFTCRNNIRHIRTPPYHPSSNGQVERAVQTFKDAMGKESSETLQTRVARFLFHYRTTPHTTTGISPAELMMGRRLRTHMSCLLPDTASRVANKQESQKQYYDRNTKPSKQLVEGQIVLTRDFSGSKTRWVRGRIKHGSGPMSYSIDMEDGRTIRRHVDHTRPQTDLREAPGGNDHQDYYDCPTLDDTPMLLEQEPFASTTNVEVPQPRRSGRARYTPKRYQPET